MLTSLGCPKSFHQGHQFDRNMKDKSDTFGTRLGGAGPTPGAAKDRFPHGPKRFSFIFWSDSKNAPFGLPKTLNNANVFGILFKLNASNWY